MPNISDSTSETDPTGEHGEEDWLRLVDKLRDEVPLLVEEFLSELETSRLYVGGLVNRGDLADSAAETFVFLIERLRSAAEPVDQQLIARRLGRLRARQGVAMQDLVDAVQLDFPVLWRRLRHHAGTDHVGVLIDHVERVHVVVDRYSFSVREEFLRETARIAQNLSVVNQRHLARLFAERGLGQSALADVATGLGVDASWCFEVAVIPPEQAGAVRRAVSEELAAGELFGHELGPTLVVLRPPGKADELRALLHGFAGVLFPAVDGLADVRVVARGAVEILQSHPGIRRLYEYPELLPGALLQHIRARWVPGYLQDESQGVVRLAEDNNDLVIATVRTFLTSGTVKAAASALYCHRNTVVNRLNAFTRETGLDVTRPDQAAAARLLLPVE